MSSWINADESAGFDAGSASAVVEFPSMTQLRRWYSSDDYSQALEVSRTALRRRLLFVPGIAEP